MKKSLLILSFSNIAKDARVIKQVKLFAETYRVTTCGYGEAPLDGVEHITLPEDKVYWRYPYKFLAARLFRFAYWNNEAVSAAYRLLKDHSKFDAILANDIDTVGLALKLRPIRGVHADLHEFAPKQNEEKPRWNLTVGPYMSWMARNHVAKATSVTVAGAAAARGYKQMFGIESQVVTNATPYREDLTPQPVSSPIRLVYSGIAARNRQIETIMHAVGESSNVTLDLYLMPNEPAYLDELRELSGNFDNVFVKAPVEYSQLIEMLNLNYDVGIPVIPPLNYNYKWALPNKFFDYVQARLGVIIGQSPEMMPFLIENGFGVAAKGFEKEDIKEVIKELTRDGVAHWKNKSDDAAFNLSAETQIPVWGEHIVRLMNDKQ